MGLTRHVAAVPAALPRDQPARAEVTRLLVERARGDGIALTGGGSLPALVTKILPTGSKIELQEHASSETVRARRSRVGELA